MLELELQDRVRSGWIGIGSSDSAGTRLQAITYGLHYLLNICYLDFRESNNIDLLSMILSTMYQFTVVQQII